MKVIFLTILLFIGFICFSQNRYSTYQPSSNYQPENFENLSYVSIEMKRKHDANLKYLFSIKEWVLKLKTQINDDNLLKELNVIYNGLSELQKGSLSNSYKTLKETELYIRYNIIESYKQNIKNEDED